MKHLFVFIFALFLNVNPPLFKRHLVAKIQSQAVVYVTHGLTSQPFPGDIVTYSEQIKRNGTDGTKIQTAKMFNMVNLVKLWGIIQ